MVGKSVSQNTFLKGRQILDAFLIANEIIGLRLKVEGGRGKGEGGERRRGYV